VEHDMGKAVSLVPIRSNRVFPEFAGQSAFDQEFHDAKIT
jgi:hypothetical protein